MGLVIFLLEVILLGILALAAFLVYKNYQLKAYFAKKDIPFVGAGYSNILKFLRGEISLVDTEVLLYKACKTFQKPIIGFADSFTKKGLIITDLDLARNIFVKDFDHFFNRRNLMASSSQENLMDKMLVFIEDEEWKGLRVKLSPTFTTGKIRKMFSIFERSSERMKTFLEKMIPPDGKDLDITFLYSKFSMDVIASCAFGIESKTFETELGQLTEFEAMAKRFQFNFKPIAFLKMMFAMAAPSLAKKLAIDPTDYPPQRYFIKVIQSVMDRRRATGERQDDFLQMIMDVQKGLLKEENAKETLEVMTGSEGGEGKHFGIGAKINLADIDVVANSVMFLGAGFDTLHSLIVWTTYALAVEQEVQAKLRKEIKEKLGANGGKLSYDSVHEMAYLDKVINESLRYYTPATRTERKCMKDYKVPGTDIIIEKDTMVVFPILGVHRDEEYYKNAEKFDPERFTPEEKAKRHPYSFLPFGHGPRNCIGMRFALTEAKMVIASLIKDFQIEPCSKTDIPAKYAASPIIKPKDGMWLRFKTLS